MSDDKQKELVTVDKDNWKVTIFGVKKEHYDKFMDWCREHTGGKPNIGLHMLVEQATLNDRINKLEERVVLLESKEEDSTSTVKRFGSKKQEVKK